jgi:hypothetical protein
MGNTSKQRNIAARKRLAALYERGVELRFTADGVAKGPFDEPLDEDKGVAIWIAPPSPLQRQQALNEASASRARATLRARREDDSAEALAANAFLASMGHATLVDYVLTIGESDRRTQAQREVLALEEWEDFTALRDAMRQWDDAGNPDDDEWRPLVDRDREFGRQVNAAADRLREAARETLDSLPRAELERRAFDKRIDLVSSQAFMSTFEEWMMYYSCRDDRDHSELFFDSPEDLADSDQQIQDNVADAVAEFIQDPAEAKNSQGAASGSEPSELPEEPETSEASTPEEPTG